MRHIHRLLGCLIIVATVLVVALPALAGGGGGGGGTTAVTVPALSPVVFVIVQGIILAGYLLRRRFLK